MKQRRMQAAHSAPIHISQSRNYQLSPLGDQRCDPILAVSQCRFVLARIRLEYERSLSWLSG
jgi:hypothetical protein